eukprot:g46386.t1
MKWYTRPTWRLCKPATGKEVLRYMWMCEQLYEDGKKENEIEEEESVCEVREKVNVSDGIKISINNEAKHTQHC